MTLDRISIDSVEPESNRLVRYLCVHVYLLCASVCEFAYCTVTYSVRNYGQLNLDKKRETWEEISSHFPFWFFKNNILLISTFTCISPLPSYSPLIILILSSA